MRYSEQVAFNTCPWAYKLSCCEGIERITEGKETNARDWGRAIHAGLEAHYKGLELPVVLGEFSKEYPEDQDPEDLVRTRAHGDETLRRYLEHYKEQDKMWRVLATELEGQIEIAGEEHDLHIDLVAENVQSGSIYFWDHKTTVKTPSDSYWKAFEMSGQLTRYSVYVEEKFKQCAGAIINNICVGYRKKAYKGEPAGFWVKFERQIFNRTPAQIAQWRESDETWMKLIELCKKEGLYPKALSKACSWCEFYELCLAANDPQIKELLYKVRGS